MSKHANEILDLKKNPCITFGSKPHAYLRMICLLPYVFADGKYRQVLGYHTNDFEVTTKE